ncbi:GNAT family N-acetyltransferase [Halopenitus persicus]|uniref:Acetyltransferase (GNAT) family protein n=1 Tax=Halopenitus persicus TaxID=1048396 RepID=A0A1H3DS42_9EURY|nr:GNAT family N-acetyltransferase [Halopenitus persicus]QHS16349.1 GNAT family N-acetyltransferase [haloarchaeon 3A1-DGR]SDX69130.1 Acetyltransferase (GNAT) family protein [Halopenitus persicus]
MQVRPACPGDAEALRAAVSRAGETAVFDDFGAPILDVSAAGVREAAATADCSFLVEADGKPVGVALAHPDPDGREAELLALWVHPDHAADDVETTLLGNVARSLARDGVEAIRTTVPHDDPTSREFYRANGFNHKTSREGPAGTEIVFVAPVERLS